MEKYIFICYMVLRKSRINKLHRLYALTWKISVHLSSVIYLKNQLNLQDSSSNSLMMIYESLCRPEKSFFLFLLQRVLIKSLQKKLEAYGRKLKLMWHFRNDETKFRYNSFKKKSKFDPKRKMQLLNYIWVAWKRKSHL